MRNARHDFRIAPKEPSLEPVETREDWEAEEVAQGERHKDDGLPGIDCPMERHADN